jgi:G:T-mismatch repair DNA endonuclease (very short patch repair protein)
MSKHTVLPLFREKHRDLHFLASTNIVGGLSIVNHRYHEKDVTVLPNGKNVQWIYSHDCNGLYLWGLGEETGTGLHVIWRPYNNDDTVAVPDWGIRASEDAISRDKYRFHEARCHNNAVTFARESSSPKCTSELEWLEWTSEQMGKVVEHRFNGRQFVVVWDKNTRYPVDGYIPAENLILQFHGCYWHGHGCQLDGNNFEDSRRRRTDTETVTERLRSLGYNIREQWECEWRSAKDTDMAVGTFLREHVSMPSRNPTMSAGEILNLVKQGAFFGLVECDVEVPWWDQGLIDYFEEFPPICKNVSIGIDDVGNHMREYAELNGMLKQPRRNLINSFWARKMLITTPLLKWYMENGLVVPRVYQAIEMKPKRCFASIRDEIADHRRRADGDPAYKPTGESWKTLGNSLYGKTATNKLRHKDHKVVHDDAVQYLLNDRRFNRMEEVGDTAYEVAMDKRKIKLDLPLTVALFVYSYAKLRMLQYVYDFMKRYFRSGSYQIVCSDTDSIIAAYESRCLDDLVKPELLETYRNDARSGMKAFLATDQYSLRTPGLFKVELEATGIVALCAKTYFAWNDEDGSSKCSSKGLSKKTNAFGSGDYKHVLDNKVRGQGRNYGFRVIGDRLMLYQQDRAGLSYLYVKRRVHDDGISTTALHL